MLAICFAPVPCAADSLDADALDLAKLPPNTWVEIKYTAEQPNNNPDEQGRLLPAGWNKMVYDPDGKRVLFYDRWFDKKHGGFSIYGNCLLAFDPAAATLKPVKIDNWSKKELGERRYRTLALPENDSEPTPCPRHVYHAFDYVPELKVVIICNGANQSAQDKDGNLVGHRLCDGAWRLDLKTNQWTRLGATECPPNRLDDAMAYCPDIKSMVYVSNNRQVWIMDIANGQFRKAKQSPSVRPASGVCIFYDPTRRRMLIAGGGPLEGQFNEAKSPGFREMYAFDPKTETVEKVADCPTALYEGHLAYDAKHEQFVTAAVHNKGEQPSGMFAYDPKKDSWHEIKPANAIPAGAGWFGWLHLCYDAHHDCLIGKARDKFYAFRYVPAP
jgi:hypothetical protein